jgi:hypothetical protein
LDISVQILRIEIKIISTHIKQFRTVQQVQIQGKILSGYHRMRGYCHINQ